MFVARDKTGRLFLYYTKPKRHKTGWHIKGIPYLQLDKSMFPNLKWEDEPREVELYDIGISERYEELKDSYDSLHMTYLSQVSLYKSLYEQAIQNNQK